ncbi:hypothetical protein C5688_19585 [Methylocystis sp. MitZ-2018]|nr:hypothetical protein C5688_19585 [Methylocystis sp. MitZ-2018]
MRLFVSSTGSEPQDKSHECDLSDSLDFCRGRRHYACDHRVRERLTSRPHLEKASLAALRRDADVLIF